MANELQRLGFDALASAPASVVQHLEAADLDTLAGIHGRAETAGLRSWMLSAICAGIALSRARYGENAAATIASRFKTSSRTVQRLGLLYSATLRPRIEALGARATFPLAEARFYELAATHADRLGRSAIELLEHAEREVARGRYSAARFASWLANEGGTELEPSPKLSRLVRRLARATQDDVAAYVAAADADDVAALAAAVALIDEIRVRIGQAVAA